MNKRKTTPGTGSELPGVHPKGHLESIVELELQKKRERIEEIERARSEGRLASLYGYVSNYEDRASEEVHMLEDRIHRVERAQNELSSEGDLGDVIARVLEKDKNEDEEREENEDHSEEKLAHDSKAHEVATLDLDEKKDKTRIYKRKASKKTTKSIEDDEEKDAEPATTAPAPITTSVPVDDKPKEKIEDVPVMVSPTEESSEDGAPKSKDEEKPKAKRQLGIVSTDLIEKQARELASQRMERNKNELKGVGGFFKKIWTHNIMAEYYREKEIQKIKEELGSAGSVFGKEDVGGTADKRTRGAILDRFLKDLPEPLVHQAAGELSSKISDPKYGCDPANKAAAEAEIKAAMIDYVKNPDKASADGNLKEAVNRAYMTAFKGTKEAAQGFNPGGIAENILGYAEELRGKFSHAASLAELDAELKETEITFGKATTGARTEAAYTWRDRIIEKMAKSPVGRFVNETTIAAGVCVAASLAQTASRWSLKAALGFAGGFLASGAIAGQRESQAIKRDRAEHARAMASGRKFNESTSPRRKEINETTYSMLSAREATESLRAIMGGAESPDKLSEDQVNALMTRISEVRARISLSDVKNIDLISYSNEKEFEVERTALDIEIATACAMARQAYEKLGMDAKLGGDFDNQLALSSAAAGRNLYEGAGGIQEKDKIFNKLKNRRVWQKAAAGAAVATVAGFLFHEGAEKVHEWMGGASGNVNPAATAHEKIQQMMNGGPSSPAERIDIPDTHPTIQQMIGPNGVPYEVHTTLPGVVKVPEGFHIIPSGQGHFELWAGGHYDANGNLVGAYQVDSNIEVDSATHQLTPASISRLNDAGIHVSSYVENPVVSTHGQTMGSTTKTVPAEDYYHSAQGKSVHRLGWADNGTVRSDLNELRLNDPVIGPDGKIHISIENMTAKGSMFEGKPINVKDMVAQGRMQLWASATRSTQFNPEQLTFDQNGQVTIDPNSPLGKMFKFDSHGHVIGRPRFTEAVAIVGQDSRDGLVQGVACATDEGADVSAVTVEVPNEGVVEERVVRTVNELEYTPIIEGPNVKPFIPIPVFLPRSPLERTRTGKLQEDIVYYGYTGDKAEVKRWSEDFSPRLKDNPDAKLDPKEEIQWYFEDQKRRNPGYLENELNLLEEQDNKPMGDKVEAAVCLAVAGHQESKNIYRTLETYLVQKDKKGKSVWDGKNSRFEIFVYVNWPAGSSPKDTLDEINRFKKEHPEVILRVYEEEIKNKKVEVGWYKKKIFDLALSKCNKRGVNEDIVLIANDADMTFTSVNYLDDITRTMNSKGAEGVDALAGRYDLDPNVYEQYPVFHAAMKYWQFMESVMRIQLGQVGTQGRNTAMKGSSYAAIGGNRTRDFWADVEFGQLFNAARGRNSVSYLNRAWVMVDPRREIDKFKKGEPIAQTWSDFNTRDVRGVKPQDEVPENLDMKELAEAGESDPIAEKFRTRLESEIQEIVSLFHKITVYPRQDITDDVRKQFHESVKKAAGYLGIEMESSKNKDNPDQIDIKIVSTQNLRRALMVYNDKNRKYTKLDFGGEKHPLL